MLAKLPVVLAAAIVLVYVLATRRRAAKVDAMQLVRLADVPRVLELLTATHRDGAFAVFLFGEPGKPPASKDALNFQFSIENGRVGFDWVLLSELNVAARDRVTAFFERRRSPLKMSTTNDVSQLRTETGDLVALSRDLLRAVFGVTEEQNMELIAEGFTWTSADLTSM